MYVCGDAARMAHDVHTALVDICRTEGNISQSDAENYLSTLTEQQRYQKDVWVA